MSTIRYKIVCFRPGGNGPISGGTFTSKSGAEGRVAELRKKLPQWRFAIEPTK